MLNIDKLTSPLPSTYLPVATASAAELMNVTLTLFFSEMPTKRRRESDVADPAHNSAVYSVLVAEQRSLDTTRRRISRGTDDTQQDHQTRSPCNGFFEDPAVRAWYNGERSDLPNLSAWMQARPSSTPNDEQPATNDAREQPPCGRFATDHVSTNCNNESEASDGSVDDGDTRAVHVYDDVELATMDEAFSLVIPSSERLKEIRADAIRAMAAGSEEMKACCVCELSCDKNDIMRKELTEKFVQCMRTCIWAPPAVPAVITGQYSASHIDSRLEGLLLLPAAIHKDRHGVWCQICTTCNDSITGGKAPSIPANAIANGNYIGWLPRRFQTLTRTDEQAVALILPCVSLSVVTGGPCRTIKSHHYVVRNTEGPITEMLPRDLNCRVRVTMVGHMTSDQVIACKRRYRLNLPLCRRFLNFLNLHNQEYKKRQHQTSAVRSGVSRTCTSVFNPTRALSSGISVTVGRNSSGYDATDRASHSQINRGETSVIVDHTIAPREVDSLADIVQNARDQSTYSTFGSTVEEGEDATVEDIWITAASVLQSPATQDFVDVVVRKSNDYVPTSKWSGCLQMFPTLFPAGCGGPTEFRQKPLSVRQWILRCLRVHGHRFEKHYAFMLLAFDYLAMENARRTLYIKMNVKQQALKAAEVERSTVLEAIKYFHYLSECRAKGMKPRPPMDKVQRVIDLRKGIRAPESAFYGSNIGRMRARFDLFGLLKRFGPLQIFFTISPDSAGTYNIAVKSDEISEKTIQDANFLLLPNRAERKKTAASFPVECARYFLRVVNTVIEVFLGWDRNLRAPKRGGGIFGVVRAFGASAETQVAGDLHAHFAVWLHGFPTTYSEFNRALVHDVDFRRRVVGLADSALCSKPPCLVEEQRCVRCNFDGTLRPIVPGVDAFRRPAVGAVPPTTAMCSRCGATFKDKDVIDASLLSFANGQCDINNAQWKDFEKCRSPHYSVDNTIATSILVRDVQVHYWNHCKSCFKKTVRTPRGSICRFLKPEPVHLGPSLIDENMLLRIHRPIGCEYVNAYNRIVMDTMKCNHDAQFVLSNGSKATAAYVVKYCFKAQNPVENQIALSLAAFTKAAAKTNTLPTDTSPMERGYKILGSMLYTVTNGQEVAAPMAALYILNESPFWFSHEFIRVDLWQMLRKRGDSVEISISQREVEEYQPRQGRISSDSLLEQYWKRKAGMEDVSFIDILERFECVKSNKCNKRRGNRTVAERVSFARLKSPKVFVVCGKEIPDIMSHLEPELRNFYYVAVLTLFKPHRQTTLLSTDLSPIAGYRAFLTHGNRTSVEKMQAFESQWQDYYQAQRSSDTDEESAEARILRTRASATDASVVDGWDQVRYDQEKDMDVPDDFADVTASIAPECSTQRLSEEAKKTVETVVNLKHALEAVGRSYRHYGGGGCIESNFDVESYPSRVVSSTPSTDRSDCLGTHDFITRFQEAHTRLEFLRECFAPVPYEPTEEPPRWSSTTLPEFPQIAMVSKAFQLNFWQHVVFEVSARHLLYAYSKDLADALSEPLLPTQPERSPYNIKDQLIGYLGGEAGTGKSTVVAALLTFARKWGRAGSVETLAFTGVASINIQGRTMHSARNLKLSGAEPNAPPTIEMKSRFSGVVLVIVDEISITDQGLLGGTDAVSRSMSATSEKFMGGKHILLIGDWLQLPPVAGSPCFHAPPSHASRQRQTGYALYDAINFVIFLTQNMRARFDPEYTKLLDDLRWGRLSDTQLETLNSRVQKPAVDGHLDVDEQQQQTSYRPVVVCTNKLRCAINNDIIFRTAAAREIAVYECLARPSARSKLIVEHLANVNDNLTDRIPMKLLFYVGMPVMVTHKHPDLLEADILANGVIGTLVDTYPPLEEIPQTVYEASGVIVIKLLQLPALLFIKLQGVQTTLVEGLSEGVIGLPPLKGSVHLSKIPNLSQASVTVTQFALVPAFACTTEKLQGQTCYDGIVVTPSLGRARRRGSPRYQKVGLLIPIRSPWNQKSGLHSNKYENREPQLGLSSGSLLRALLKTVS